MTRPLRRGAFFENRARRSAAVDPQHADPESLRQTVLALRGDWK